MKENYLPIKNSKNGYRYFNRPSLKDASFSKNSIFNNPREIQVKGDIRIGRISNTKLNFGIRKKELVQHMLLLGRSGSGKTNVIRLIQLELNKIGIPFVSFDLAKYGTRFLKHYMDDLMILRWDKEFSFNPLQPPPGVNLKEWLLAFTEITTEIFGLRTASKLFLTEFIQKNLFQNYEVGKPETFPTMHDLSYELEKRLREKIPVNERGYINGIKGKVKTVCITLEETINVRKGIPIEKLLRYPACIELVGIKSSEIQIWIISLTLAWIAAYREARQMSFGGLKHTFIFDEAAKILGKGSSKEGYLISCIRRLREYGEAMILADQSISSLQEVVKANVYTTLCLSQTSQKDRREVISVLGLNAQQAEITNFLETGQGIIRLAGRYPYPQLLNFPFVKPRNISEKNIDKINSNDERIRDLMNGIKAASRNPDSDQSFESSSQSVPEKKKDKKDERILDMLRDIANRFDVSSTQRAKDFGLSGSSSDKIFKQIEKDQLAEVIKLNLSGRGGMSKYFSLTELGYEKISKTPPKKSGGTSAKHFFLERYLKKHLPEKGFSDLVIEKNIGGKRIDLFGKFNDLKIGIEICCSTMKTEYLNVQKDSDKCDVLIIVTPDKKTKESLVKELYKKIEPSQSLKVCLAYELFNDPYKIISKS